MINLKLTIIKVLISFIVLISLQCETTEPPENKASLELTVDDVSCTEAWLTIKTTDVPLPASLILKQNDITRTTISLSTADTLLYIDSLLPKQNYSFQITSIQYPLSSNKVTAATLDTTSHNFTWQTFTFGQHSSSVLYDVAIINENNIWAVGEIYMKDSLGNPDPHAYNAVQWDGSEWKVKKISVLFRENIITPPLEGIFAFSSTDIWFVGSLPIHGDGNNWTMFDLRTTVDPNLSLSKAWGSSSNNIYFVGRSGNIAHYKIGAWTKIESGTTLDLVDIHGNSKNEIFSAGVNIPEVKGVLLKGNGNQFSAMISSAIIDTSKLFRTKLYGELASVWVDEHNTIYTGGNLLYHFKNNKWNYVTSLPENFIGGNPGTYYRGFIYSIRGNGANDYIIAGDRNTLKHFNGISWQQIGIPYSPSIPIIWFSVQQKASIAVAVGDKDSKAFLILLKK